eukprot:scaffold5235_cov74-Skeletonema_dohrnii-CCMP3373.AAC.3
MTTEEHCEKIEVCLECKEEIHAMFACNYGAKCSESLDAACLEEAVENVDDHNDNTHNSLNSDDVKAASTPSSAATRGFKYCVPFSSLVVNVLAYLVQGEIAIYLLHSAEGRSSRQPYVLTLHRLSIYAFLTNCSVATPLLLQEVSTSREQLDRIVSFLAPKYPSFFLLGVIV